MKKADQTRQDTAAGTEVADVWALKRAGQARDLERQRQGSLRGADIGRGMAAVVKRVQRLAY